MYQKGWVPLELRLRRAFLLKVAAIASNYTQPGNITMRTRRTGFTLIELLIVVVIIGILASIAIPKFADTKEKAYFATMKGDLRNLITAQEAHAADNGGAYMAGGTATASSPLPGSVYAPSPGVTIVLVAVDPMSWTATATHPGTLATCGVFMGGTAPGGSNPATVEGEPRCE